MEQQSKPDPPKDPRPSERPEYVRMLAELEQKKRDVYRDEARRQADRDAVPRPGEDWR
jgi:hypothetical protein